VAKAATSVSAAAASFGALAGRGAAPRGDAAARGGSAGYGRRASRDPTSVLASNAAPAALTPAKLAFAKPASTTSRDGTARRLPTASLG